MFFGNIVNKTSRHKTFISYYHKDDQFYKNEFENRFGHIFINKSVSNGEIDTDLSTNYIKRLIQKEYITDTSVLVVLIGPNTRCRKHVDWEISAALNKKVGGYSGLIGILLPEFPLTSEGKYYYEDIPPRLADNIESGYANIYTWDWVCASESRIKKAVDDAFQNRISKLERINNSLKQFQRNRCE
ncbi:TIR domain-containing protein [Niallia sp. JL1B1071]|uniref:TIR domain-containing protein n=1 Tax=Niallia tiangongensis TaxID=3237105 RepID=UPI0037DC3C9C